MSPESGFPPEELKKFSDAGRVIAAAMNTSVETWARAEAGVILKTWAGRTKVASARQLDARAIAQALHDARRAALREGVTEKNSTDYGDATINIGMRTGNFGRVWYRTRKNGKFQMVRGMGNNRVPWRIADRDWPKVDQFMSLFFSSYRKMIQRFRGAAGLSRQSIVQIADDLGIRLESVKGGGANVAGLAKARAALATDGRYYRNGFGITSDRAEEFSLTLVNRYPKAPKLFMDRTLQSVISGRLNFFRRNLEEGVFLSAERTARKYPYLEVLRTAA